MYVRVWPIQEVQESRISGAFFIWERQLLVGIERTSEKPAQIVGIDIAAVELCSFYPLVSFEAGNDLLDNGPAFG